MLYKVVEMVSTNIFDVLPDGTRIKMELCVQDVASVNLKRRNADEDFFYPKCSNFLL